MQEILKKLQDSNKKQSNQILKLNESVTTIYKKVESTDSTIKLLYKEQLRANKEASTAAKRAAAEAKRASADNPLKKMAETQKKEQKKGNDLLSKILAALAGLAGAGAVIEKIFDKAKEKLINFGKEAFKNLFGKDGFFRKILARTFGKDGFLRKSLARIFGKDGFIRKQFGKLFGKDSFIRKQISNVFGKDGFLRKQVGNIFGKNGFIRKQFGQLVNRITSLLPKIPGAKALGSVAKGVGGAIAKGGGALVRGAGGAIAKGGGALLKSGAGLVAKGAGGLLNFATKRGPLAALFAAGDELASGGTLGRASARGAGAAGGAAIGASLGSVIPVVGTLIGGAIGSALGDFLGGWFYDNFSDLFEPIDKLGQDIVTKFNEIKEGIVNWWNGIGKTFENIKKNLSNTWKNITGTVGKIVNVGKKLASLFVTMAKVLNPVTFIFEKLGGIVKNGLLSRFFGDGKQEGGPVYLQKGGPFTVPGHGSGDKVPMLLPEGSFVLNRNASQHLQYGGVVLEPGETVWPSETTGLKEMNRSIGRFQSGGVVEAKHPDTGPGWSVGKDAQGRPSVFTKTAATAFKKAMDASGGLVKTSDITSSQRSKAKNEAVGGVVNSNHLYGTAVDIHGTSKSWLKENGPEYGWKNLVYSGHDGHFDFTKGMGGYNKANGDGRENSAKKVDKDKGKGLFGGPSGLMGSALGWLGNLVMQGEFEKGYLEGAKKGGLAMQLYDLIKKDKSNNKSSGFSDSSVGAASISDPNARALLNAIAVAEGTSHMPNQGYNTHFGHSQTEDLSKHPDKAITAGGYTSTAFGRYQFLTNTWNEIMGGSMEPDRQDKAALKLVARRGVNISDGLSTAEIYRLGGEWASIEGGPKMVPGGSYGSQAKYSAKDFMRLYEDKGGFIQKKQKGGRVSPVLLEPGEKVFGPGSWGSDIEALNTNIPRFQSGGTVGMRGTGTNNGWIDSSMNNSSQPTIVVVNAPASGGAPVSADPGIQTPIMPSMSDGPTSPLAGLLMTQSYLLADRIG